MKRLKFLTSAAYKLKGRVLFSVLCTVASSALADGTVYFQNGINTRFYLYTDAVLASNVITSATLGSQDHTPTDYGSTGVLDVGLVWGTTVASLSTLSGGTLAGIEHIGTQVPGELNGTQFFIVSGAIPGNDYYFQLYAWDSSFGDSIAGMLACVAAGGYFGAASAGNANQTYGAIGTPIFTAVNPVDGPGTVIFGDSESTFGRTIVLATPEPTTLLLGATGALGLLLFGRRKQRG
jgi:hypothetical protein